MSALCLCVLTTLLYWPALSGGFIFDDYPIFAENPAVNTASWHWEFWQALWGWSLAHIQRPLAMLSYALNYALGDSTFGFKATNLGIHLLNVVLVFLFTKRLLKRCWLEQTANASQLNYWACGIAAAWAIHPLQVSTVMYVVQRMELMGFTFTLIALLAYWHARECQMQGRRAWPLLLLCSVLVIAGYGAKETAILVPGYTLLIELAVFRFESQRTAIKQAWKAIYMASCLAALVIFFAYLLPHYASPGNYIGRGFDAGQRELTQLRALCMYLGFILLPLQGHLHFYYDNYSLSTGFLHPVSTLFCAVFLLGLLGLAVAVRRQRPLFALGIGWFFVAHALTSAPLSLELVFEHRNYPALLGVVLAITDLIWLAHQRMRSYLPAALAVIFLLNFCFLTVLRAATWGSPLKLAISLTESNPGSARAALDLARRYVALSGDNPTNPLYAMGIKELQRAIPLTGATILPEEALLTQVALHPGPDPTPWWISLQSKLETQPLKPDDYHALQGLMELRLSSAPNIDANQLAKAYQIAIARSPNRISLHVQYAELAARALDAPAIAIKQWQQVVILEKAAPDYVQQLTTYLANNHRIQEAAAVLDEAESIQPALQSTPAIATLRARVTTALEITNQSRPVN